MESEAVGALSQLDPRLLAILATSAFLACCGLLVYIWKHRNSEFDTAISDLRAEVRRIQSFLVAEFGFNPYDD